MSWGRVEEEHSVFKSEKRGVLLLLPAPRAESALGTVAQNRLRSQTPEELGTALHISPVASFMDVAA
ncbi:uncharacterized [Tachysurus ichikawai]